MNIKFIVVFAILACVYLDAALADDNEGVITIPIAVQKNHNNKNLTFGGKAKISLYNLFSKYYYGIISVGTPAQKFKLMLDTGSADLWIPTSDCKSGCDKHTKFVSGKSSSYREDGTKFTWSDADNSMVKGKAAFETVEIGGLKVKGQKIGLATTMSGFVELFNTDGFFGLGPSALSKLKSPNFIDNAYSQGLIKSKIFGVYLNKILDGPGGELTIGGYNSARFTGNIHWVPLTSTSKWEVKMDSVSVTKSGKKTTACTNCKVVIDTGSSFIFAPAAQAKLISKALGFTTTDLSMYCADLPGLPDLVFRMNGFDFNLSVRDYIFKKDRICYIVFVPDLDYWVLGDSFISSWYSIFDGTNKRIGFAKTKY